MLCCQYAFQDTFFIRTSLISTAFRLQELLSKVEGYTPVQVASRRGEELISGREDAPGCKDVKKQVSLLRERHASVLERTRVRRDRLLGAADRFIADFRNNVRSISVWIQETWKVVVVIVNGQGEPKNDNRKLQVRRMIERKKYRNENKEKEKIRSIRSSRLFATQVLSQTQKNVSEPQKSKLF